MAAGTHIILQGDTDATKFYILESGTARVLITDPKTNKTSCVLTYGPGRCATRGSKSIYIPCRKLQHTDAQLSGHIPPHRCLYGGVRSYRPRQGLPRALDAS